MRPARSADARLSDLTSEPSLTGGCLCGGVRFELSEPATMAGYCHCTRCQRRAGSGSSAQARIDGRTFTLVRGEDLVQWWRHPDGGFEKGFCRNCGAHLFSRDPNDPTQMSIRLPAFDGDPGVRPSWRAHVASAARVGAAARRRPQALRGVDAAPGVLSMLARELRVAATALLVGVLLLATAPAASAQLPVGERRRRADRARAGGDRRGLH